MATEESANAAAEQLLAAEEAAAAQAEARKAKKQRRKAKKQQPAGSQTPEEAQQSQHTSKVGLSAKPQHAHGAVATQHDMQTNHAESSVAELAWDGEQVSAQPAQHEVADSRSEMSASSLAVYDEGLQSAAPHAVVSSSCEKGSSSQVDTPCSEQKPRLWFHCPISKVCYAFSLHCLL